MGFAFVMDLDGAQHTMLSKIQAASVSSNFHAYRRAWVDETIGVVKRKAKQGSVSPKWNPCFLHMYTVCMTNKLYDRLDFCLAICD